ncbi:dehydrogenase/reductase SDR family member 4 isoform X5 [Manis javanica]|uniref:dehydrogenase/reductase SDR family member 4 isoform X5 n=1 Tax=Manis javanica TaxID=9974 RepID=UPI003C6D157A
MHSNKLPGPLLPLFACLFWLKFILHLVPKNPGRSVSAEPQPATGGSAPSFPDPGPQPALHCIDYFLALNLYGGIDILISNAAVSPFFGNLLDATEDVWDKILSINVKAAALMTKAVVPEMEKRGGGSVVIVASIAAYNAFPGLGPYNVSKTALLGLTKNLALELAQRNIRVNCLAPGLIKTNFSRVLWMDKAKEESIKETMQIRRMGKPEECAGIVSFLCSEDASYITGETVVVGGGTPSHL